MKKITLPFLVMLSFHCCYSQKNFIPGYIIKLNGDTLRGFIDYRNWGKNPNKIGFKEKNDSDQIFLNPLNILRFCANNESYESAIVQAEDVHASLDEFGSSLNLKTDTTFLRVIIDGQKKLYIYSALSGAEHFYIKQNSTIELLVYKKYLRPQDGLNVVAFNNKYAGQLIVYLNDCKEVQSKLDRPSYEERWLKNLFKTYYEKCSNEKIVYEKLVSENKVKKHNVHFGVLYGMSLTTLKAKVGGYVPGYTSNYNGLGDMNFSTSKDICVGINFEITLPRNRGRWSINNELMLTSYQVSGSSVEKYTNVHHSATIGYSYMKINSMARYYYPIKKVALFINPGISVGLGKVRANNADGGTAISSPRNYEIGIFGGLGARFKQISFETRYETGNGMSDLTALSVTSYRLYFLMGIRF